LKKIGSRSDIKSYVLDKGNKLLFLLFEDNFLASVFGGIDESAIVKDDALVRNLYIIY
jgi:hypothetical protein